MKRALATLALPLFLAACGSDDDSSYDINLVVGDVDNGVADVTVTVTAEDGSELPTNDIQLSPLMIMTSGMEHGTPFEGLNGQLNEQGEYSATAYFLMPSSMGMGEEAVKMGDWSITVSYDGEQHNFPINVEMMGSDVKRLKGSDTDTIMSDVRTYYLFNRGRHINAEMSMNMFEVYVAARETMMDYQGITEGNVLNEGTEYELEIANVTVEMCTMECSNEENWKTAMAKSESNGIYQGMNLGLSGDNTDMVHVRLSVNNELKDNGDPSDPETSVMFTFDGSADGGMMHNH